MIVLQRDMKAASETCKVRDSVISRTQTFISLDELKKTGRFLPNPTTYNTSDGA